MLPRSHDGAAEGLAHRVLLHSLHPLRPPREPRLRREYITRFRLEKKDPTAPVSEPVKPIVFYLAREVPEKWRPYLKKGVEDWNVAFEQAGFRNAIQCKDAPTKAEDPDWDPEDVRHSVIRWAPSPIANAMGRRPGPAQRRDDLGARDLLAQHPPARRELVLRPMRRRRPSGEAPASA
jgi:hypothetical protein